MGFWPWDDGLPHSLANGDLLSNLISMGCMAWARQPPFHPIAWEGWTDRRFPEEGGSSDFGQVGNGPDDEKVITGASRFNVPGPPHQKGIQASFVRFPLPPRASPVSRFTLGPKNPRGVRGCENGPDHHYRQ